MQKVKLSIIVPVFNEEATVYFVLEKLASLKLSGNVSKEIIIVDDGSTDNSREKILEARNKLKINNFLFKCLPKNQGKGYAVAAGIKMSTGSIVTVQDADLEYDPKDLNKLLKAMLEKKASVVYGTRLKNFPLRIAGQKKTPLLTHFFGNKLLTFVTNILYGAQVTDMETCYKMVKREVLDGIKLKSKRFEFEPEITAKILKKGYKIYEVAIRVNPRGYEEGKKITWKDGFIALWTLIKYRFTD